MHNSQYDFQPFKLIPIKAEKHDTIDSYIFDVSQQSITFLIKLINTQLWDVEMSLEITVAVLSRDKKSNVKVIDMSDYTFSIEELVKGVQIELDKKKFEEKDNENAILHKEYEISFSYMDQEDPETLESIMEQECDGPSVHFNFVDKEKSKESEREFLLLLEQEKKREERKEQEEKK